MNKTSIFVKMRLEIEPVGKGRPRFDRRGFAYTPAKTRKYESDLATLMGQEAMKIPSLPFEGPVELRVYFYLRKPKGGKLHKTRTDLDNYLKAVCDAANGILWKDDRQIVNVLAVKDYAAKGCAPYIALNVIRGE